MKRNNQFENAKIISLDFKFNTEIQTKIDNWKKENIFFGVFPTIGDSMTCSDLTKSIPNGSKVLVYDLQINCSTILDNVWHQIPTKEPLLIIGKTNTGKDFFVCKTISSVDAVNDCVLLHSYNPMHQDKLIPFDWITNIYKVVQIV